jgi:hypothetical protein
MDDAERRRWRILVRRLLHKYIYIYMYFIPFTLNMHTHTHTHLRHFSLSIIFSVTKKEQREGVKQLESFSRRFYYRFVIFENVLLFYAFSK